MLLNRYRVRIVGLLARLSVDVLQGELRDVDLLLLQGHRSLLLDYLRALVARLQWITALIKVLVSGLRRLVLALFDWNPLTYLRERDLLLYLSNTD